MGYNDGIDHFKRGNYHNALNLTARNYHLHRHTQLIGVYAIIFIPRIKSLPPSLLICTDISLLPLSPAHALPVPHWVPQVVTQSNGAVEKKQKKNSNGLTAVSVKEARLRHIAVGNSSQLIRPQRLLYQPHTSRTLPLRTLKHNSGVKILT